MRFRLINYCLAVLITMPTMGGWFSPVQALALLPTTSVVAPNSPINVQQLTNDPLFGQQNNLRQVQALQAWDVTTGTNVLVAIVDTGVDINHEDLVGKIWVNSKEVPTNNVDDDGNGYVDDVHGYNFYNQNSDVYDHNGHGTGVASIIAARTNNGSGVAGISWGAQIMPVRALNNLGGGDYADVAAAIRYATDNGAQVINMSFGTHVDNPILRSAVDYAIARGVVIVAAAGNDGRSSLLYPAAYPAVISVGAVDSSGQRASFSNYGTNLDIVAPGFNILMAGNDNTRAYVQSSGTSFAAAHVTGLAALMLSQDASLSPAQIEATIKQTATSRNNPNEYGSGLINMLSALNAVSQSSAQVRASVSVSRSSLPADGSSVASLTLTLVQNNLPLANYPVKATVDGTGAIINNYPVPAGGVSLGNTNSRGQLTFTIRSNMPGSKMVSLSGLTSGVHLHTDSLVFTPSGPTVYSARVVRRSPDISLEIGSEATLWVELENTGNVAWSGAGGSVADQFRLATVSPRDRTSVFKTDSWISANRVTTPGATVNPGEITRLNFTVRATQPGQFSESFSPVIEYRTWVSGGQATWRINVSGGAVDTNAADYSASVVSQSPDPILAPGQSAVVSVTLSNTGTAPWINSSQFDYGAVRLGTFNPSDRSSPFRSNSWISGNRVIGTGFKINPQGELTFGFTITAPPQPGAYTESFRLVAEYITWFGPVVNWRITVR